MLSIPVHRVFYFSRINSRMKHLTVLLFLYSCATSLNSRDGKLCNQLRTSVKKNVKIKKVGPSYSSEEFVDSLEFQYSNCLFGNDTAYLRTTLWNCSGLVTPSASSEKYKELGLKYAIEYIIYVRDPLLANPALYFGVDSMNIVRCVKRGMVRTSINY